mgnify:CR=1 FL=1
MVIWVQILVDIQTVSLVLASLGVIVAAIYYITQIRHQTKIRQTDLLMRLAPWLNMTSGELQRAMVRLINLDFKDYGDFVKKYGPLASDKPEQMAIMTIGNYFEAVGDLLSRKLLDLDLVWDYWGETFVTLWQSKFRIYVEGVRKELGQLEFADAGEYLYNEMKKREQRE